MIATGVLAAATSAGGQGWLSSYDKAAALAKKTDKLILADFTGSDWCGWCKKLKKEVFSTEQFKGWAAKNAVLLELDFPRSKPQSDATKARNKKLLKKYGVHVTTVYPYMVNTGFYDDVQGETWAAKMSMKLLPYYSDTPEKVGRLIFEATRKRKRVEMINPINDVAFYGRVVPLFSQVVARSAAFFLAK